MVYARNHWPAIVKALDVLSGVGVSSMDARKWTDRWMETIAKKPEIATDYGTMLGWFANAIMAGYDEAIRRHQKDTTDPETAE